MFSEWFLIKFLKIAGSDQINHINYILVKIANYRDFYIGKWTVVILEACNYERMTPL